MCEAVPLVSVVVVCFNGLDITRQCLKSIFSQDYQPLEIIVVDNGSQEDISGMVSREFPRARLIRLPENIGFAGGHNRGIEAAQGKYAAIINNDAVASPAWIRAMVEEAGTDERIGAVSTIIMDGSRPGFLDSCGVGIALDGMSRQAMRGMRPPVLESPREVLLASGCVCLFRMEALRITGLFDESFFAYCEDTDLGLRLRWAGYRAVIVPGGEVTHYSSMTAGKFSIRKIFWVERNHFWVAVKNFPCPILFLVPFVTVWRFMVQMYAVASDTGEVRGFTEKTGLGEIAAAVLRALLAALAGIPLMLRRRKALAGKRKISSLQMMKLIMRFRMPITEIILGKSSG
ncbi:MAG: glycosyltransferase family 2 protein [Candidatus Latescibacter sp.]|nr:glycosyltransferase family 2 protein [Candidatus Latescibacter sp.]